jgi:hypothetical protein
MWVCIFGKTLEWKMYVGIFHDNLVYICMAIESIINLAIWYIVRPFGKFPPVFGMLHQEKSGNPVKKTDRSRFDLFEGGPVVPLHAFGHKVKRGFSQKIHQNTKCLFRPLFVFFLNRGGQILQRNSLWISIRCNFVPSTYQLRITSC